LQGSSRATQVTGAYQWKDGKKADKEHIPIDSSKSSHDEDSSDDESSSPAVQSQKGKKRKKNARKPDNKKAKEGRKGGPQKKYQAPSPFGTI
jgi:hypothetical protein